MSGDNKGANNVKMELRSRALDKLYKRRDRIDMPDFQREEVWTDDQKRQLIDTILRGWHLPKFYFRKIDEAGYECVDGQQRLAAIFEFFDGHLRLEPKVARLYGGRTYKELRPTYSDAFDDFDIDIEEIEDATDANLEELFVRLQLGTPLTTAEKLNAIRGDARTFAKWMSDQEFFDSGIAVRDTRYAHFDMAVKWLFVEARGIQPQMRFAQLESFLKEGSGFDNGGPVAKRIRASLSFLRRAIRARSPVLRNRASVLSICMLAARVVEARLDKNSAVVFGRFVQHFFSSLSAEVEKGSKGRDAELRRYQEAISYGSTGGDSIKARLSILSSRLAAFDPVFAPLLKGTPGTGSVQQLAEEVGTLVYTVNERAAAQGGGDVFKMTNKSARALKKIGAHCVTPSALSDLIDNLYFLVYEGTGDCKRLPSPPPDYAMDVKFLRTQLRHDLDHGDAGGAAKKRRRGGAVARRYLGTLAIDEASREQCEAGHIRLLKGFRDLLLRLTTDGPTA